MDKPVQILHLEDDAADADLVQARLESDGVACDITHVDNRADFVSALSDNRFDLILADYSLPSFDGLTALNLALDNCPDVPYIFVSGKMGEDIAVESLKSGATDYVLKDKLSRLAPAIRRALREAEDRAECKWAEGKISDLNRVYAVLSSVNQLIIRETDQQALFENICRIAVDKGRFAMAWVGLMDEDTQMVRPVAYTGCEEGYLTNIRISVDDAPEGEGPTGTSIRTALHVINNDTANNPDMLHWRAEALKRGYLSSASFPLMRDGKSIGAIVVYAQKPGFFSEDEVLLLDEMAADISFAMMAIEQNELQRATEEKNRQLAVIVDSSNDAIIGETIDGIVTSWNLGAEDIYGYTPEEIIGKPVSMLEPPDRKGEIGKLLASIRSGKNIRRYETRRVRKDGSLIDVSLTISPIKDADGSIVGASVVSRDITDIIRTEEALRNEAAITGALLEAANVASRNLVWGDVASNVAGLVHELTASKSVFIFLLSNDDILLPQSSVGLIGDGLKQFYDLKAPVEDIICFKDALTSKSTMVLKSDELECFGLADFTDALMLRELVLTPIITRDRTVGFLCVNFDRLPQDHRVLAIIEGIARQLGVAHDSGRLYQETQDKSIELARSLETLKVLYDIDTKVLSTLDREEVLTAAVSQLRRVVPADIACVLLLEEETGSLRFHYGWCMDIKKGDVMALEQCTGAVTLESGMTMVRNNLAGEVCLSDFDKALYDGGIRSDLFVPIICKGKGVGLLQVGSFRVAGYTPEDIKTIERLSCQIGIALENARLLSDVEEMFINVVTALSSAIDAKSPWTKGHSERVTNFALMIADQMGLSQDEKDRLKLAGLLHDIGKIGTYDVILDKPARLTDEEFELVKKHPDAGADILQSIKQFKDIIPLIRYHHERWDGKGYPAGLSGVDIPLLARILCIADSCDSMTADRPYRPAPGYAFAVAEFRRCAGIQFDPEIVEAFLEVIDERLAA